MYTYRVVICIGGDTTGVMICIVSDLMTETMYTDTERKKNGEIHRIGVGMQDRMRGKRETS